MYNDTHNTSNLIELQLATMRQEMETELQDAVTEEDRNAITSSAFRKFFGNVGKPLMVARRAELGHLPYIEDYNTTAQEITNDVSISYGELEHIGTSISEAFNYAQNEKTKLKNRINMLSSMATDFNLMSNESDANVVYFKDSFTDYSNIDMSTSAGTLVNVSTSEGIATLARTKSVDCNAKAKITIVSGNGDAGNYNIAKRTQVSTDDGSIIVNAKYISDDGAHDDPAAIIDGRPDTWFEYQTVNISEADRTITLGYDIEWAKGKEYGDKLRLRIIIDLSTVQDVNWIDINPYIPEKSNGRVYIYSIKTSEDGIDYETVSDGVTLNNEINRISHPYSKDKIFVGNVYNNEKIASQGTFWFPPRKTRYIEIVMDQDQSYTETIGHTYYEHIITKEGPAW
jgi:hypothetical protein